MVSVLSQSTLDFVDELASQVIFVSKLFVHIQFVSMYVLQLFLSFISVIHAALMEIFDAVLEVLVLDFVALFHTFETFVHAGKVEMVLDLLLGREHRLLILVVVLSNFGLPLAFLFED